MIVSSMSMFRRLRRATPFPYTTLFRSEWGPSSTQSLEQANLRYQSRRLSNRHYTRSTAPRARGLRSEEHTSELQSLRHLVCRLLLEKKKTKSNSLRCRIDESPTDATYA